MFSISNASPLNLGLYALCLLPSLAHGAPHPDVLPPPLTSEILNFVPPYNYTGDVINVTKCYCQDPATVVPGALPGAGAGWGHFYKADYYNFHADRAFTLSWKCLSHDLTKTTLPVCWDTKHKEKREFRYPDGNLFAYKVGKNVIFGDGHNDHYYFNDQKRALPAPATVDSLPTQCDGFCKDQVGGTEVARDPGAPEYSKTYYEEHGKYALIRSTFASYNNTDDMCPECK